MGHLIVVQGVNVHPLLYAAEPLRRRRSKMAAVVAEIFIRRAERRRRRSLSAWIGSACYVMFYYVLRHYNALILMCLFAQFRKLNFNNYSLIHKSCRGLHKHLLLRSHYNVLCICTSLILPASEYYFKARVILHSIAPGTLYIHLICHGWPRVVFDASLSGSWLTWY